MTVFRPQANWAAVVVFSLPFLVWETISRLGWISPLFFPPPTQILTSTWEIFAKGEGSEHLLTTLRRLAVGSFLGGSLGLGLGLVMGYWPSVRRLLDPLVSALHPIPKITVLPLIMVVLGIGENTKYAVVAVAAFFPMLINTMAGVQQIHRIHFEVARNYGAGWLSVLRWVILPGSLPMILAGVRLALNSALVITLAVELVAADQGLGRLIWQAWLTMRVEQLYVGIGVGAAIGILINLGLAALQRHLVPWQEADSV